MVNPHSLVGGGGFNGTKFGKWGPLRWDAATTKDGGVVEVCWCRGIACPASDFPSLWDPQQFLQDSNKGGIQKTY